MIIQREHTAVETHSENWWARHSLECSSDYRDIHKNHSEIEGICLYIVRSSRVLNTSENTIVYFFFFQEKGFVL